MRCCSSWLAVWVRLVVNAFVTCSLKNNSAGWRTDYLLITRGCAASDGTYHYHHVPGVCSLLCVDKRVVRLCVAWRHDKLSFMWWLMMTSFMKTVGFFDIFGLKMIKSFMKHRLFPVSELDECLGSGRLVGQMKTSLWAAINFSFLL